MRRAGRAAALWALLFVPARAADGPVMFRPISFDAALKEAAARNEIVMVDFYTPACAPCARMDKTTWIDPGVASAVAEKAVALRVDAFADEKLAARYRVKTFPTVLFVRPDGKAFDRLIGFVSAPEFLADFKDALAGRSSLRRARAQVAGAKGDARLKARMELATLLAQRGDSDEALKEYLWLYDDGMKKTPAFAGVRSSYLLSLIKNLGDDYAPAKAALLERRAAARRRLAAPGYVEADGVDFASINWILGESAATLEVFDSFAAEDPRRGILGPRVFALLLEARRYDEAARAFPAEKIRSELEAGKSAWISDPQRDAEQTRMMREYEMENAAEGIEALAGSGKLEEARDVIRRMRSVEDAPWVRAIILKHLERAGRAELLGPA